MGRIHQLGRQIRRCVVILVNYAVAVLAPLLSLVISAVVPLIGMASVPPMMMVVGRSAPR